MSRDLPRRRAAQPRRTIDATAIAAVLLPLVTVAVLLTLRPTVQTLPDQPPTLTPLTTASVVCPAALEGAPEAYLSTAGPASESAGESDGGSGGPVILHDGQQTTTEELAPDRVTTVEQPTEFVVTGEGALAAGLVGARFGGPDLARAACSATPPAVWFTAVGAGAQHSSVLELVNPDAGRAVADITVYGETSGAVDVPALRGVSVPGRSTVRLELAELVPRADELALHVVTSRGRLGVSVLDTFDRIGSSPRTDDWLPAQLEPATDSLLMGLPGSGGQQTLVMANPGDDEVRASVKVVGEDSVFAPAGVDEIRIPPQSAQQISLDGALRSAIDDGSLGLQIESSGPVTATLRSVVDGDLSHTVPGAVLTEQTSLIVPPGKKQAVFAGATSVGVVTVVAHSADGEELASTRTELRPGLGTTVTLPSRAVLVSVVPQNTSVVGAVVVSGRGTVIAPLVELDRSGLVPGVRPGLP